MTILWYKLTEPVGKFREDDVLGVTERFGDWHLYDVKLERATPADTRSVELTWDELRSVSKPANVETAT